MWSCHKAHHFKSLKHWPVALCLHLCYGCLLGLAIALLISTSPAVHALPRMVTVSDTPHTTNADFSVYPTQIQVGNATATVVYHRQPGYYAIHQLTPATPRKDAVVQLQDGAIAVVAGTPDGSLETAQLSAVYALQPGGAIAVPTGLVLVEFGTDTDVIQQTPQLQQAGYNIAAVLPYAPHAAWVRAQSGEIAAALTDLPKLRAIAGVVTVEPQMLMERALK